MTDPFRPLKDAFGRFATGVAIAGCAGADGAPVMITVNSFTSVSLVPPLVLWCIEKKAASYPAFAAATSYAVSVLSARQQHLSERFAAHAPAPLSTAELESWETGAPIVKGALAAFDCRVVARHDAGDHVILVAEVVRFASSEGRALLYFASRYASGPETSQ